MSAFKTFAKAGHWPTLFAAFLSAATSLAFAFPPKFFRRKKLSNAAAARP